MKSSIKKKIAVLFFFLVSVSTVTFYSCTEDDLNMLLEILDQTGWLKDQEEMENIPEDITPFDDTTRLASAVSLESKFPPIGNQGSYGTCVAWSVGYNLKTALNAIEKSWGASDLSSTSNQTSPKDLWLTIPSDKKGAKCEGTNFEPALDALIADGAASLSAVPYTNLGSCTGTKTGSSNNRLANYRKIASETEGLTPENFKGYLNSGRPISFGARLGDRFMNWNSSAVINSDTYNDPGMQHAYHAMVLVGYDDSKHAFRVRNSWGSTWGDNGSIWIDYDFFCKNFCFAAFVAQNVNNTSIGSGGITGDLTSGYDLLAYSAEDNQMTTDDPAYNPDYTYRNRRFTYDVYNSGTLPLLPSQRWSALYMYYNATDANDYQIIFEDYYTDDQGEGDGYYASPNALVGGWYNNYRVEPGKKAGEAEYGPDGFSISYVMPAITGKYYLVLMADGFNRISEANEDNNFYFITADNGKPLEFQNGNIVNAKGLARIAPAKGKAPMTFGNTENQTLVKPGNLNAYTPNELRTMLLHDKKTGTLDAKIRSFRAMNAQAKGKPSFVKSAK